jgi:6-pyruvoyltetrahydropterin 2'-reductase
MAKNIRYSEIFYSFQGEAELAGKPSVWIRFFGCNLECNGFGQMDPTNPDTYVLPFQTFDVSTVKRIEDLPVWKQGCDSSYSWSAKYKNLVHNHTAAEIAALIVDQMRSPSNPTGDFIHPVTNQDTQLCFTGGEPMMWQGAMQDIIRELQKIGNPPHTVTVETNATRPITPALAEFINSEFQGQWHWAMSPKLWTVAGEKDAVKPEVIFGYMEAAPTSACLKFVCNGSAENWQELETAHRTIHEYLNEHDWGTPAVWVMPVGATKDQQESADVADLCMEAMRRGYNIATRNHAYVFGNVIGK